MKPGRGREEGAMRFMMLVKADAEYEAGKPPSPELMAAVGKLSEEQARAGILLESGGLMPSARGARIKVSGGTLSVVDGPFSEAKELIGGYAILRASSKQEAIELGKQFMSLHSKVLGASYVGELEVRELAEFPPQHPGR
jgi:hypothetical protein